MLRKQTLSVAGAFASMLKVKLPTFDAKRSTLRNGLHQVMYNSTFVFLYSSDHEKEAPTAGCLLAVIYGNGLCRF